MEVVKAITHHSAVQPTLILSPFFAGGEELLSRPQGRWRALGRSSTARAGRLWFRVARWVDAHLLAPRCGVLPSAALGSSSGERQLPCQCWLYR